MMDFLRGLAPHHGNDATRAVPAVPSRFESASAIVEPAGITLRLRRYSCDTSKPSVAAL